MVSLTTEPDLTHSAGRQAWLEGMAISVIGKDLSQWNDGDVERFRYGALELCNSFIGAEEMALTSGGTYDDAVDLYRVSVLDSLGTDRSMVTVIRESERETLDRFTEALTETAQRHGVTDVRMIAAALANLMNTQEDNEHGDSN